MVLYPYYFPVTERPVAVFNGNDAHTSWNNEKTYLSGDYKAIVREDTNELISIVRNSYRIIPNEVIISKLLNELERFDSPYRIDPSHSFVSNEKMRLQVTLPEFTMTDKDSEIALSLFLHNSYDTSEGVRMFFGAIRYICSNGMVFGKVLSKFYARHTKGFDLENLRESLSRSYELIPGIQNRIGELESRPVTSEMKADVETHLGKRIAKDVLAEEKVSQWVLLNAITHIISHAIEQRQRARYQMAVAKVFDL